MMVAVELFCLTLGIYLMTKHNYLREKRVVLHRSIQNIAIIFFLIHAMVIACGQYKYDAEVGSSVQVIAMWTIVFSLIMEYLFLVVGLISYLCQSFSKKKTYLESLRAAGELDDLNIIVYKKLKPVAGKSDDFEQNREDDSTLGLGSILDFDGVG